MDKSATIASIRQHFPNVLAIYAFGSRINGTSTSTSDLDLALLVPGYAAPLELWDMASTLANSLGCEVDLLDFRLASTVMQNQILWSGERWWFLNSHVDGYEASILSELTNLNTARGKLLEDIAQSGSIYA